MHYKDRDIQMLSHSCVPGHDPDSSVSSCLRFVSICTSFSLVVSSLAHKQKGAQIVCAELTICGKETAYIRHLRIPPLLDPDSCPLLLPKIDTVVTSKTTSVFCLFLNLIWQEPQDAFFLPSFLRCYTDECQPCVSEVHPRPAMTLYPPHCWWTLGLFQSWRHQQCYH